MTRHASYGASIGAALCLATAPAVGHHGPPNDVLYDLDNIVELEGTVTELFWRNPHVRFRIQLDGNQPDVWEIESGPVTWLSRLGWTSDIVSVGDRVRVAGYASTRRSNEMALTNMLLPNGLEFTGSSRPRDLRFSNQQVEIVRQEISESLEKRRSGTRMASFGSGHGV